MNKYSYSRRDFIKTSSLGVLASLPILSLPLKAVSMSLNSEYKQPPVFIFSKHLQFLNFTNMSEAAKEIGFDGIDLTVRPKGHVIPERVEDDLPKATEAMKSFGLSCDLFSSGIEDASNPTDRKVLEVATQLGFKHYRTAWFKYLEDKDILESLNNYKSKIHGLANLNQELGITGCYQNISGPFMGASIWDLQQVLAGLSPQKMGSQYDVLHATVEAGKSWEIGLRLIKDHINTIVVKDFFWKKSNGTWKPHMTPMGEGMIDFPKFFSLLKKYNINVPISIHAEYDLGGAENGGKPTIDKKEVFARIKKDLDFVKKTWSEA